MSGAAAIAAAKNRRGKSDNATRFPQAISCSISNKGSPPVPVSTRAMPRAGSVSSSSSTSAAKEQMSLQLSNLVDPDTLQILGPMPPAQILKFHEQRLNRFDERMKQCLEQGQCGQMQMQMQIQGEGSQLQGSQVQSSQVQESFSEVEEECFSRISDLESKLAMLEEVIMNLQNKLTVVQNFTMETNLDVSKLKNLPAPVCTCTHTCSSPVTTAAASEPSPVAALSVISLADIDIASETNVTDLSAIVDVSDITNVSMSVSEIARF